MRRSYEEILRVLDRLGRSQQGQVFKGAGQWLPAADACIDPGILRLPVLAGKRALSAVLPGYVILLLRKLSPPFRIGLFDFVVHCLVSAIRCLKA